MIPYTPTHEKQADMLVKAGMRSSSGLNEVLLRQEIASRLRYINYRRFEAYRKRNLVNDQHGAQLQFFPGTYWEDIWARYVFDSKLRRLTFDSSACVEVALRTLIAHFWAEKTKNDFPHRSSNNYSPSFPVGRFLSAVDDYYRSSPAEDAVRYRKLYADVRYLPVEIFVEFTTFGNLRKLIVKGFKSNSGITKQIATEMGMGNDIEFFLSGISLLRDVRNCCAHQARIWNKRWLSKSCKAILGHGKNPLWDYRWDSISQTWTPTGRGEKLVRGLDTTAAALTFSYQVMKAIAPRSHWRERLVELLTSTNGVPKQAYKGIGFTNPHWMEHPLWK